MPGNGKLELEDAWHEERAARVAGTKPLSPLTARVVAEGRATERAVRSRRRGIVVAVVLVLAVLAAGIVLYLQASKQSATEKQPAARTRKP